MPCDSLKHLSHAFQPKRTYVRSRCVTFYDPAYVAKERATDACNMISGCLFIFYVYMCCCKKHCAVDRHSPRVYKLIKHVQVNAKLHRPRICGNKKQFRSISTENCCRLCIVLHDVAIHYFYVFFATGSVLRKKNNYYTKKLGNILHQFRVHPRKFLRLG